jgi:hypothetical protein
MTFHVGQQVVCVNDNFSPRVAWRRTVRTFPRLHAVYTIRGICHSGGLVGLYFCEIENPPALFGDGLAEAAFNSRNFRPVRKTSIDIFEKLLAPLDSVGAA